MIVLLINVAAVLFMTGFIWTMQLVHYPLLDRVGAEAFPGYETGHNRLFFLVAGPVIIATLVSGVLLLFSRPPQVPRSRFGTPTLRSNRSLHRTLSSTPARNTEWRLRPRSLRVFTPYQLDPNRRLDNLRDTRPLDGLVDRLSIEAYDTYRLPEALPSLPLIFSLRATKPGG